MRHGPLWFMLAVGAFSPALSAAQTVRGTVVSTDGAPVPGVVVFLTDTAFRARGRALTDARGEFLFSTGHAGSFRVRVVRIGYAAVTSEAVSVATGEVKVLRLPIPTSQLVLDTIRVVAQRECTDAATDRNGVAFQLLDQARAAVAAALSSDSRGVAVTAIGYERHVERASGLVRWQNATAATSASAQPWSSLPADILHRDGYMSVEGDAQVFHAPNLDAFSTGIFEQDHCFRVAASTDARLIGLAFEPVLSRRRLSEIRGTLWLDRETSELRRLEFRYTNAPRAVAEFGAGSIAFVRLRNGQWLIPEWSITLPLLQAESAGAASRSPSVNTLRVEGGLAIAAVQDGDTLYARPGAGRADPVVDSLSGRGAEEASASRAAPDTTAAVPATATTPGPGESKASSRGLRGVVRDSSTGQPLVGAIVEVSSGGRIARARTDETGAYQIDGLSVGRFDLLLRRIGYSPHRATVELTETGLTHDVAMRPSVQSLDPIRVFGSGMGVYGRVAASADSRPLPGARVQIAGTKIAVMVDSTGAFFVPIKSPGAFVVRVTAAGFTEEVFTIAVRQNQVVDASTLLDAGDGRSIHDGEWVDMDQRLTWRTPMNSALATGADLRDRGTLLVDAVESSVPVAKQGLRFGRSVCVFINGRPGVSLPLTSIAPEDVRSIEVYGADRVVTKMLNESWPKHALCSKTGRNASGKVISYLVIWTY